MITTLVHICYKLSTYVIYILVYMRMIFIYGYEILLLYNYTLHKYSMSIHIEVGIFSERTRDVRRGKKRVGEELRE